MSTPHPQPVTDSVPGYKMEIVNGFLSHIDVRGMLTSFRIADVSSMTSNVNGLGIITLSVILTTGTVFTIVCDTHVQLYRLHKLLIQYV